MMSRDRGRCWVCGGLVGALESCGASQPVPHTTERSYDFGVAMIFIHL